MESYGKIMGLVEEVRDILDLHEVEGMGKAHRKRVFARIKATHDPNHPDHHPDATQHAKKVLKNIKSGDKKKGTQGHAGSTTRNPFKNIKKGKHLGGTSGDVAKEKGPSTTTPGTKRKKWRCRCSHYHCICTGKGKENSGQVKHVEIGRAYKKGYNKRYKAWRAKHASRYAPGGKAGFKKPVKPGKKGHAED